MKFLTLFVFSALVFLSCNKDGGSNVELKTDDDKAFYALGAFSGTRLKDLSPTKEEVALMKAGFADAISGGEPKLDPMSQQMNIQKIFKSRMEKKAESDKAKVGDNKKDGAKFLEDFVAKEGGIKTKSGLAYKMLKEGSGKMPKSTDEVEVHYVGKLINGKEFDSSVKRGKTVSFPLGRVIKGWIEGLQLVKEGGKIKLVIPSDLGYGDRGAPPNIPGGSTLVFEVELFKVKKGGAKKDPHAGIKNFKKKLKGKK